MRHGQPRHSTKLWTTWSRVHFSPSKRNWLTAKVSRNVINTEGQLQLTSEPVKPHWTVQMIRDNIIIQTHKRLGPSFLQISCQVVKCFINTPVYDLRLSNTCLPEMTKTEQEIKFICHIKEQPEHQSLGDVTGRTTTLPLVTQKTAGEGLGCLLGLKTTSPVPSATTSTRIPSSCSAATVYAEPVGSNGEHSG